MSRIAFDNYGRRAAARLTYTEKAGRHNFQSGAEALIVDDVGAKLELVPEDRLLEIGCGPGNLLIPLSLRVSACTGVDHPAVVADLRQRCNDPKLVTIEGNFLDLAIPGMYSKILVYSVVHVLSDIAEVQRFIDKALTLLEPGGRLLVGDIPNDDRMKRFLATPLGREVTDEYRRQQTVHATRDSGFAPAKDDQLVRFRDADLVGMLERLRERGFDAFLIPQGRGLPFAYTREDLLVYG